MKMILVENSDGNLFWLPENYKKYNVDVSAGVPELLFDITSDKVLEVVENTNRRIKEIALSRNIVPNPATVNAVLAQEIQTVLNRR